MMLRIVIPHTHVFVHSVADNGTIHMWDWRTGYNFQRIHAAVQPGSLDSESGIFACMFDHSESRLITAEADKTIKVYKEDDTAVSFVTFKASSDFNVNSQAADKSFDDLLFFPADGRKPSDQLETRNPQEKEILMIFLILFFICCLCHSNSFISTKPPVVDTPIKFCFLLLLLQ